MKTLQKLMKRKNFVTKSFIVGVTMLGMLSMYGCSSSSYNPTDPASAVSAAGLASQLDGQTQDALIAAIQDEYKARAFYKKVIDKFGAARPFSNIIKAEEQHVQALIPLFTNYGIPIPPDNWYSQVPQFASIQEACAAGVHAEIENIAMYDGFFSFVQEQDIIRVFTVLRNASQYGHLPAFERCAQ